MRAPKRRKKRSKPLTLSKYHWLRHSADIKAYRECRLASQGGVCAITGVPLTVGCLDHVHVGGVGEDGSVRGVLLSEANTLEGRYLKQFNKLKMSEKYGLTFPDFLISMGTYLKEGASSELLHFKYMEEVRKSIARLVKGSILTKLEKDFGIVDAEGLLKAELVKLYMQNWINKIED